MSAKQIRIGGPANRNIATTFSASFLFDSAEVMGGDAGLTVGRTSTVLL